MKDAVLVRANNPGERRHVRLCYTDDYPAVNKIDPNVTGDLLNKYKSEQATVLVHDCNFPGYYLLARESVVDGFMVYRYESQFMRLIRLDGSGVAVWNLLTRLADKVKNKRRANHVRVDQYTSDGWVNWFPWDESERLVDTIPPDVLTTNVRGCLDTLDTPPSILADALQDEGWNDSYRLGNLRLPGPVGYVTAYDLRRYNRVTTISELRG